MSRLRGRKRETVRLRVVELALRNVKPKDIAERFELSPAVVWKLIQQSPEIRPLKERVSELVAQGVADLEITEIVGRSRRRVLEIKQQLRGGPSRPRPTPDQNVERFLANPEEQCRLRYTKSQPFAKALISRCVSVTDSNPVAGLSVTAPAIRLFESHVRRRRESAARLAFCRLFQARGIRAHALMQLKDHENAWKLIQVGLKKGPCGGCYADYQSRAGLILASWGYSLAEHDTVASQKKYAQGLVHLDCSIDFYSANPHVDHDLYGNGIAHALLNRSILRLYYIGGEAGAADARAGLLLTDSKKSPELHGYLLHDLALSLMSAESPNGRDEARQIVNDLLVKNLGVVSVPSMRLRWVSGLLFAICGDIDSAIEDLAEALSNASQLTLEAEVAAIAADLFVLDPDPATVSAEIAGLCAELGDTEDPPARILRSLLPAWLPEAIRDQFTSMYHAACHSANRETLTSMARSLRAASASLSKGLLMPAPAF